MTLKVVPKAACDSKSCSENRLCNSENSSESRLWLLMYTEENWQQRIAWTEILMRLSEQSLESATVFKEVSRDLIIVYLFHKDSRKFKNHLRIYRKYRFNLKAFKKIFNWWHSLTYGFQKLILAPIIFGFRTHRKN